MEAAARAQIVVDDDGLQADVWGFLLVVVVP